MEEINKNEMNMMMLKDKVNSLEYLSDSTKCTAINFGGYYLKDSKFLYEILGGLEAGSVVLQDQK